MFKKYNQVMDNKVDNYFCCSHTAGGNRDHGIPAKATRLWAGGPACPSCSVLFYISALEIISEIPPHIVNLITTRSSLEQVAEQLIHTYQQKISPKLNEKLGVDHKCKFAPSCSQYMLEAIRNYGFFKGLNIGVSRLKRCTPNNPQSGYDPLL
jgi:hypothetical protein